MIMCFGTFIRTILFRWFSGTQKRCGTVTPWVAARGRLRWEKVGG